MPPKTKTKKKQTNEPRPPTGEPLPEIKQRQKAESIEHTPKETDPKKSSKNDAKGKDPGKKKGGSSSKGKKGKGDGSLGESVIPDYACEDVEIDNPPLVELRPRTEQEMPAINPLSISHIGLDFTGTALPQLFALCSSVSSAWHKRQRKRANLT